MPPDSQHNLILCYKYLSRERFVYYFVGSYWGAIHIFVRHMTVYCAIINIYNGVDFCCLNHGNNFWILIRCGVLLSTKLNVRCVEETWWEQNTNLNRLITALILHALSFDWFALIGVRYHSNMNNIGRLFTCVCVYVYFRTILWWRIEPESSVSSYLSYYLMIILEQLLGWLQPTENYLIGFSFLIVHNVHLCQFQCSIFWLKSARYIRYTVYTCCFCRDFTEWTWHR